MMYHFMFGLRGASLVATPSAPGVDSPPAPAWFFSSSCMIKLSSGAAHSDLVAKIAIQEGDALLNHVVDNEKVHAKNEYCNNDHRGGGLDFLPRGRGNLAHFGAHVVIERFSTLRPALQLVSEIFSSGRNRVCHCLLLHFDTS